MTTPGPEPTELERQVSALADEIIEEGKTGYNWSRVDELLQAELGLTGISRCKRASGSGRAANVLTESNDKDIALYLVFAQAPYTIDQFKRVARDRMARFPNVRAVAIADRVAGTWRIRSYLERQGAEGAPGRPELTRCFPLLGAPRAMEDLPPLAYSTAPEQPPDVVSFEESDFDDRVKAFQQSVPREGALLKAFETAVQRQALRVSRSVAADLLACCLSGQLVFFAGPSGSGKSRLARCLAHFFAPEGNRYVLESRRQLLGPEDIAGYYSNIAERFALGSDTVGLVELHEAVMSRHSSTQVPFVVIEEANLSPIEGYLAPIVHGLGAPSSHLVRWRLHTWPTPIEDQELRLSIPPTAFLGPFPRFLATINVDASALAPARKVVSRGLVVLMEPEEIDRPSFVSGIFDDSPEAKETPDGAGWIGDPVTATRALERAEVERLVGQYLRFSRGSGGDNPPPPSYRDLERATNFMSNYVALLSGSPEGYDVQLVRQAAVENAFLHIALPLLSPAEFRETVKHLAERDSLTEDPPGGLLKPRIARLNRAMKTSSFSDVVDFWTALS